MIASNPKRIMMTPILRWGRTPLVVEWIGVAEKIAMKMTKPRKGGGLDVLQGKRLRLRSMYRKKRIWQLHLCLEIRIKNNSQNKVILLIQKTTNSQNKAKSKPEQKKPGKLNNPNNLNSLLTHKATNHKAVNPPDLHQDHQTHNLSSQNRSQKVTKAHPSQTRRSKTKPYKTDCWSRNKSRFRPANRNWKSQKMSSIIPPLLWISLQISKVLASSRLRSSHKLRSSTLLARNSHSPKSTITQWNKKRPNKNRTIFIMN